MSRSAPCVLYWEVNVCVFSKKFIPFLFLRKFIIKCLFHICRLSSSSTIIIYLYDQETFAEKFLSDFGLLFPIHRKFLYLKCFWMLLWMAGMREMKKGMLMLAIIFFVFFIYTIFYSSSCFLQFFYFVLKQKFFVFVVSIVFGQGLVLGGFFVFICFGFFFDQSNLSEIYLIHNPGKCFYLFWK